MNFVHGLATLTHRYPVSLKGVKLIKLGELSGDVFCIRGNRILKIAKCRVDLPHSHSHWISVWRLELTDPC